MYILYGVYNMLVESLTLSDIFWLGNPSTSSEAYFSMDWQVCACNDYV